MIVAPPLLEGRFGGYNDSMDPVYVNAVKLTSQGNNTGKFDISQIAPGSITALTNTTPIVATEMTHPWENGDLILIQNEEGNLAANGLRIVQNKSDDTYELTDLVGADVAGDGAQSGNPTSHVALWFRPESTDQFIIFEYNMHAADSTIVANGYMNLGLLPNGMRLETYRGTELLSALHAQPIKCFANWGFVFGLEINDGGIGTGPTDALQFVRGKLCHGQLNLNGGSNDSIILIGQDNLTGLIHHEAGIAGYTERLKSSL